MTEYFDIVDENNVIIGRASREECHAKGLLHRGIFVLVINSNGKILLQKRSMNKDIRPGLWTTSVSGHVDSGETYEEAARREMREEIGIDTKVRELYTFVFKDKGKDYIDNEIDKIFVAKHDGPFKIDKEEVDFVAFYKPKEIFKMMKKEKFTTATVNIFEELQKHTELLKRLRL